MLTLSDLERHVVDAAIYALCGSGSITAGCRSDAAVLVLVWAQASGKTTFDEQEIEQKTEEAYRYFEFGGTDYPPERRAPEPIWAIWDWPPSPSPSPSPEDDPYYRVDPYDDED